MKAKLIRDDLVAARSAEGTEGAEVRMVPRNGGINPVLFWKIGAIVDHPDAYRLVQQGIAEPADDECRDKAKMTSEKSKAAQHAYERQSRGIAPEDFERYNRGEISHILPDGSYAPGPNPPIDDDDEEDDDE